MDRNAYQPGLHRLALLTAAATFPLIFMGGLVTSHQGRRGGYRLARAASVISVADVIQAIDGPLTVTACSTDAENCEQYAKCSVRDPLWRIRERILSALATCSLQEVASDVPIVETTPLVLTRKV